jgi:hypothetical protein
MSILIYHFNCGKSGPKFWATSINLQKLPKNNRPICENSPNLVTLVVAVIIQAAIAF